jgi:hypothetical protein
VDALCCHVLDSFSSVLQTLRLHLSGKEIRLNRIPCPEVVIRRIIDLGRSATGPMLRRLGLLVIQLLCWLRADSIAGFRDGDVAFDYVGGLTMMVRFMKMRPGFRDQPGLIQVAAAAPWHWRGRAFIVLRQALQLEPDFVSDLSRLAKPRDT